MIDTSIAIGSAANGLSLLNNLIHMIQNAKHERLHLSMADIVARLPVEAFGIAGKIRDEINTLWMSFIEQDISLGSTIADLEENTKWWNTKKYRQIRSFHSTILALSQQISTLIEDFIALAHCREEEWLVSLSFADSRKRREHLREIVDLRSPIGSILTGLAEEAERLRADLGDLAQGKPHQNPVYKSGESAIP